MNAMQETNQGGPVGRPSIIEPEPRPLPDEELVAKLFRTLGDATRLKILRLLLERPRYQKELVAAVGLSQAQVSQHLACLTWCGFVEAERHGRLVQYQIGDPRVTSILDHAHTFLEGNEAEIGACRIAP
jgi:DNA-binding transcriptional ArsR family regulator